MPTPTEYFGYSVTNIGPLTTRFTPAPSCATTTPNVFIETQLADTRGLYGFPSCSLPKYEGCLPYGKELDELYRQLSATPHNGDLVYHSPGLRCPSGWNRVGVVHGGTKPPTELEGVFTEIMTAFPSPNGVPKPIPRLEAYVDVLGPSETMVWCCPKGFQANKDAFCTSDLGPLSSLSYSQRCEVYLPSQDLLTVTSYQSTILSDPLVVVTAATTGVISTSTYPIEPSETSGLVVVSAVPVVALVYRQEDRRGGLNSTDMAEIYDSASMRLKPNILAVALGTALAAWATAAHF
ncbi:uncharacterized protein MAM_03553 [Metarhizium album ARSEF 1941]|uniref:Uncharacterized protein n=1 Tax=Metarhizium album (strain ARSEF 1941) TaxID=1081103 RepID=A0A0B2WXW2_METAS|nr:uncharacterized protein MAM_03553 [Metarhizium album ARSEF 1941]KHN98429.1 hypothetical protein MAM_03553 [Metarhizium album ARSEF 1941]